MSDWGKGVNNDIGWGQGANNDIGWGSIYDKSNAGDTLLGGGSGFDPDYQAVIDYANSESLTLPNSIIQNLQNDFAISINPFFSKFKELHFWSGEAGKSDFKSIDWARLNKADYYNSPTFLANGIKGNGTSSYADLNFDADAETTIDSLTFGFYAPNDITSGVNESIMGSLNSSNEGILILKRNNNESVFSANSNIITSIAEPTTGLISISSDGAISTIRQDATTLDTQTINTPAKATQSVFLLNRNDNGSPVASQFSDDTISISFIADELTVTELGILETAIETFLNAI